MLRAAKIFITSLVIVLFLNACGGGGGASEEPSTNACATLNLNTRIINGSACSEQGSPVVALSLISRNGTSSLCSATLISNVHLITAAHCFISEPISSALVEIDDRIIFVKKATIHPQASIDRNAQIVVNDVAIIEMTEPLARPSVPILASRTMKAGDIFSIFGFGLDENGTLGNLESGQMRLDRVTADHLIAKFDGTGSNTCNGDSGGPALYSDNLSGRSALVGITSSGTLNTCLEGDSSYFVNLQSAQMLSFIRSVVVGAEAI